jgi:NAD-binding of NADP-dependent 3-hydroxyisobutyrate dehydrogenase
VAVGERNAVQACLPLFKVLGKRTFLIADESPKANLVKLSGNFLIAAVIETLGEVFAPIIKAGIARAQYLDILTNTLFDAPVYQTYGGIISEERYIPPGFKAKLGFKDIHLALGAAEALQVPMPVASLIRDRFLTLLATGAADLDWSALAALASRDAGEPSSLSESDGGWRKWEWCARRASREGPGRVGGPSGDENPRCRAGAVLINRPVEPLGECRLSPQ